VTLRRRLARGAARLAQHEFTAAEQLPRTCAWDQLLAVMILFPSITLVLL
jgi:hypothetical protein